MRANSFFTAYDFARLSVAVAPDNWSPSSPTFALSAAISAGDTAGAVSLAKGADDVAGAAGG